MHDRATLRRMLAVASASLGVIGVLGMAGVAHASTSKTTKASHVKRTTVRDGYACTIVASGHQRTVVGHAGQVVCALSGKHTLVASGAGSVVLIAAGGNNRLVGSSDPNAHDTLIAGKGHATFVAGSSGTDVIETGSSGDSIDCGTATVTVVGDDGDDQENSDCQDSGDSNVSQWWHGSVVALAADGSAVTVAVSHSSDGAQSWLATQTPACDLGNLVFDLTTNPANVQVQGGGSLTVGDDVGIAATAGTVNCEPVAMNVWAEAAGSQGGDDGDMSQHWAGKVNVLVADGSTMTVAVSDSSDAAQTWLAAQSPACDPLNLVFDLKSAPAVIRVDGGGSLTVGDNVEVEATAGTTNCVPVATRVYTDGTGSGDGGGLGGDGGVFGTVASVNGSSTTGSCGTAGATGSFTLTPPWGTTPVTVSVDTSTHFIDPALSSTADFSDVCVGDIGGAIGTASGGGVTASWVVVAPASFVSRGGDWGGDS